LTKNSKTPCSTISVTQLLKIENVSVLELADFTRDLNAKRRSSVTEYKLSDMTINSLKEYKNALKSYLPVLIKLNSFNIRLGEAQWLDTLTNDYVKSSNPYFEYYNILYNLACVYFLLGCYFNNVSEEDRIREGIKYFQHASFMFEKLIREVPMNLKQNEILSDLSTSNLSYVRLTFYGLVELYKSRTCTDITTEGLCA
jgi:hypothetical protein